MAFSNYQIFLAILLVVAGSINTISVKWMDQIVAKGKDGIPREFVHPFIQANFMLVGECLCLITFLMLFNRLARKQNGSVDSNSLTKGSRSFKRIMLLPPALMDITATSMMYFGLNLTNASSFQMLRGSVIVFVAILSMIVLKRKIKIREYVGIALIILALIVVGYADMLSRNESVPIETTTSASIVTEGDEDVIISTLATTTTEAAPAERKKREADDGDFETGSVEDSHVILGYILIIFAQLVTACQMIYEEVFVIKLDIPPLQMVGYEGLFGFIILTLLLIPLCAIPNIDALKQKNSNGKLEDAIDAFHKIANKPLLILPIIILILSIAFFNFAGISMTKETNATSRMVLDSVRIVVIWIFAMILGWQTFHYLQIIGFLLLISGMCVYHNIIIDKIQEKLAKK